MNNIHVDEVINFLLALIASIKIFGHFIAIIAQSAVLARKVDDISWISTFQALIAVHLNNFCSFADKLGCPWNLQNCILFLSPFLTALSYLLANAIKGNLQQF